MPPFEHDPSSSGHQARASMDDSARLWQPATFYEKGAVVEFDDVLYRSTGAHLSGEIAIPSKTVAQWIPLEKRVDKIPEKDVLEVQTGIEALAELKPEGGAADVVETEPPPDYPITPTYVDQGVQTDITFPPWVMNSWPMPPPFGTHALPFPWMPPPLQPPPFLSDAMNSTYATFPWSMQQQQQRNPYHQPPRRSSTTPPIIHAPMPLHLPLRLPPSLESVLAPISDPFDARYRAARAAERSQQTGVSFRGEVAGERVVRAHGCGVWAYGGGRERAVEEEREAAWRECGARGPEAWLRSARARRAAYAVPGAVRPPVRWVLVEEGQRIPHDALQTGVEATSEPLYSTRVWWKGGLHLGKAAHHIHNYASISWDSQEHTTPTFEVLCGSPSHVQWLEIRHGARTTPDLFHEFEAVEGGREANGAFIFVAQGEYGLGGGVGLHPGKASAGDDHACIGYGGGEVWIRPFRVLVYAQSTMG